MVIYLCTSWKGICVLAFDEDAELAQEVYSMYFSELK